VVREFVDAHIGEYCVSDEEADPIIHRLYVGMILRSDFPGSGPSDEPEPGDHDLLLEVGWTASAWVEKMANACAVPS
jgi:hypothetical protein